LPPCDQPMLIRGEDHIANTGPKQPDTLRRRWAAPPGLPTRLISQCEGRQAPSAMRFTSVADLPDRGYTARR